MVNNLILPTLYMLTDNNKKRFWKIWVIEKKGNIANVYREYGISKFVDWYLDFYAD